MRAKFTRQSSDERGVSPVIGVILMVAITVILAAVIGFFVLDLGSNQQSTPQASFGISDDAKTVTMQSGDSLDPGNIYVVSDGGSRTAWGSLSSSSASGDGSTIVAGDSGTLSAAASNSVSVIYDDGNGNSATLAKLNV